MTQTPIAPLDPDTVSGSDLADKLIDNEQTLLTQHSGSSRPSYAQAGTRWIDTTTNPWLLKEYDGTSDVILYKINTTSHRQQEGVDEATVASAATADVLGSASKFVAISGTTTITSLGTEPNQIKFVRATGAFVLTHHATTLVLPSGANITTVSGDTFIVSSNASGNARVFAYQRATGEALIPTVAAAAFPAATVMLFFQTAAPTGWTKDTSNFNDHAIRIVTGTPSSGGSLNFSTVFAYTATQSYTLTSSDIPAHTHGFGTLTGVTSTGGSHTHTYVDSRDNSAQADAGTARNVGGQNDNTSSDGSHSHTVSLNAGATGSTGSGGGHAHSIPMQLRYVDAIRATKT